MQNNNEIYKTLINFGHSAAKAAEIALDIKRNEKWALKYWEIVNKTIEYRKTYGDN